MDEQPGDAPSENDDRSTPQGPWAEEVVADALERIGRGVIEAAETAVGLAVLGINRFNAVRTRTRSSGGDDAA